MTRGSELGEGFVDRKKNAVQLRSRPNGFVIPRSVHVNTLPRRNYDKARDQVTTFSPGEVFRREVYTAILGGDLLMEHEMQPRWSFEFRALIFKDTMRLTLQHLHCSIKYDKRHPSTL